jgi:signal recognition particle subunit SRP54
MGDIQTLLEKAQEKIKVADQEKAAKNMARGAFTLSDFASQIELLNSMGSFAQVVKYLPGAAGAALNKEKMAEGERKLRRFKAIINSMTPKERINHKLLDGSRRKRIAKGSGVPVSEINTMIAEFEQMQQFVKLISKSGKFPF